MQPVRSRSMVGWGLASFCASVSEAMDAGQEREQHASKEQACLTCSSRLRGPEQAAVPSWSTGHPRA